MYIICSADAVFFYQYYAIVSFMYNKSWMYVAGFCTKVKCSYFVSKAVARKSFTFLCVLLLFWLLNVKLFLATGFETGKPHLHFTLS